MKFSLTSLIFILAFLFASFIFLAHYKIVGNGVWGDGRYYYSYVRSLVIDGDFNFVNELQHFSILAKETKTGMRTNMGPAIFWLPFFLLAHLIARGDGYSHIYQIFTGLGAVFYGTLGLYYSFLLTKEYFSEKIALVAILGIWLGSNLFFYTAVDPINSHPVSFLIASFLIYYWYKFLKNKQSLLLRNKKLGLLVMLGFLVGFLGVVRNQDMIIALLIVISLVWVSKESIKELFSRISIFLISLMFGFLPQLIVWKIVYGEVKSPYFIFGGQFNWFNPQILSVLFSSNNGLFYYSPILIFSLAGFYYFFKKSNLMAMGGILSFLVYLYVIASWYLWWGGAAYGGRAFISLMPFFILGLAAFINRLRAKPQVVYPLLLLLVVLNFYSIIHFLLINP